MRYIFAFICIITVVGLVTADTIYVPADYSTIQAGIDAAQDGDTVLVADGTYTGNGNKNISLEGKAIVLMSENGPENCIIDPQSSGRGFYIHQGETESTIVKGFTITNGSMGGMFIWNCTPIIEECHFIENTSSALYLSLADATVRRCVFADNTTGSFGGGLTASNANPVIERCTFYSNNAAHGGAIYLSNSNAMINSCIIAWNTVSG